MNLKWKRLAALLAVMTLVAAACGRDDSSSSSDDSGSSDTSDSGGDEASGAFIDPSIDCADYEGTAGIDGDTIKIGTIRPADGPYAIYDQVTTGLEAWVTSVNSEGGIKAGDGNSYQVELVKENDSYDPGKTPALAQKLVEQDGVFAIVGVIGTENNLAIRDYLNDACVPNIALATGSTNWGDADQYPWYISGLPSYALEANYWADYIADTKPEAKIALLYQDDDFGTAYQKALTKAVERSNNDNGTTLEIVGEQGYNPLSGTTTEAAVTSLSQTGADVFIVGIGGTPCPQTLTFIPESWAPETYISVTCAGNTAMSLAGGKDVVVVRNGQRVFTEAIEAYLRRIEYGADGYASLIRLPAYERAQVVVDPTRAFGVPIFERGGVRVDDVLERFWAGEPLEDLSLEFGVPADQLEDVLRVASRRAA